MAKQDKILDSELMATDLIQSQKSLMDLYCSSIKESSCPRMRGLLIKQFAECSDDQFIIFEWMHENGYYPIEKAEAQKVIEQKQKFTDMQHQM